MDQETLQRIERNRQLALQRRQLFLLTNQTEQIGTAAENSEVIAPPISVEVVQVEGTSSTWRCDNLKESGAICNGNCDKQIREIYEEIVCYSCKKNSNQYEFLTKETIKKEYLLSDADIESIKYLNKPNPHNARWSNIKLYLRKYVEKCASQKWNGLENLFTEIQNREDKRYKKALERAQNFLTTGSVTDNKTKTKKRKQAEIENIAKIIRGEG